MSRSAALKVQTPGAAPADTQSAQELDDEAEQTRDLTVQDSPEVAALKKRLADAEARNAELQENLLSKARSSNIYEPETPHGKERLAASETRHMTVAQVVAAIDAGKLAEPMVNYLCSDGNYCRRA